MPWGHPHGRTLFRFTLLTASKHSVHLIGPAGPFFLFLNLLNVLALGIISSDLVNKIHDNLLVMGWIDAQGLPPGLLSSSEYPSTSPALTRYTPPRFELRTIYDAQKEW